MHHPNLKQKKMKRTLILTAIIALAASFASAQQTSGTIVYEITTDVEKMMQWFMPDRKMDTYSWKEEWKFRKSKAELKFTASETLYEPIVEETMDRWGGATEEHTIYSNKEKNKVCYVIRQMGKLSIVDDSIPKMKWKVTNAMKEVAGHICMSATYNDTIMGQEITAWFALDMPIPYGPDVYHGLPGMILQIDLYGGGQIYAAKTITMSDTPVKIDKPKYKKKTKTMTVAEYQAQVYKFMQDMKKRPGGMMF